LDVLPMGSSVKARPWKADNEPNRSQPKTKDGSPDGCDHVHLNVKDS